MNQNQPVSILTTTKIHSFSITINTHLVIPVTTEKYLKMILDGNIH